MEYSLWSFLQQFLFVALLSLLALYLWFKNRFKYWSNKGVPCLNPTFLVGDSRELIEGSLHIGEAFAKLYDESKHHKFCGIYISFKLGLLVNDLDLIKEVLVKDFVHFTDHGLVHNEEAEPLEGHLFNVNGSRWKKLRDKLTPSFSTAKLKTMFETFVQNSLAMQDYIDPQVNAGKTIDLKELLARYGTDIIGTCVFGIDCKSISNEQQRIRVMSKKSQRLNTFRSIIQNLSFIAPWVVTNFKVSMYQKDVNEFFLNSTNEIVKYRKDNNIQRNDYLNTLIKMKDEREILENEGKKIDAETHDDDTMSLGDLAAQLFVFFVDGVETSSTAASFALYELARNQKMQEKLRNEIEEVIENNGGKLTYDTFQDMKYLSQVVEETLRMYPPLPLIIRVCTKDYIIPDTKVKIEKGTNIIIPMLGIHRDPEIYPNPMKFDPERFSPDNKANQHNYSHLPFGGGQRTCMGNRFGRIMTSMGLVTILSRYIVTVEPKHVKPFTYLPNSFLLVPMEGINLNLTLREKPLNIKI